MNSKLPIPSTARPDAVHMAPIAAGSATPTDVAAASRVLRNTYALLSMTLLFSAAVAAEPSVPPRKNVPMKTALMRPRASGRSE